MRNIGSALAVCAFALLPAPSLRATVSYSISDLGIYGQSIAGVALNNDGLIAVTTNLPDDTHPNSVFLISHGQTTKLATLGGSWTNVASINENDVIAGSSQTSAGLSHAVLYVNGQLEDLGTITPGEVALAAINNSGVSVGGTLNLANNRGVVTTGPNQFSLLGTLGGHYSSASDINNLGQITGTSFTSLEELPGPAPLDAPVIEAFLYQNGQMTGIGTLGGQISYGFGINDLGQIVGQASLLNQEQHAFLWEATSGMHDLGTAGLTSLATHINNQGTIIGEVEVSNGDLRAATFDEVSGYHLLEDLIPAGSGWEQLNYATDINDLGQIVGTGIFNGTPRAFLLTPVPEPTSIALVVATTTILGYRCRRLR